MPEFSVEAVDRAIHGTVFAGGIRHLGVVGSTNTLALEAAKAGACGGVWVADEQTAGRGRGGHGWHSAVGDGLYVSVLVQLEMRAADVLRIPLATGLAARAAIEEVAGVVVDLRWPNDLMLGNLKCGGILVETASEGVTLRHAVIGVGLNLNHESFPGDLVALATSLRRQTGREFAREPLLAALLRHLACELKMLDGVLDRFAAASSWAKGKRVAVGKDEEKGGYTGVTVGLDERGFLRVLTDGGTVRTVISGGVRGV